MDRVNLVAKLMVNMTKLIGDGVTVWLLLVARFILLDHAPNNVVYDQVPVLVSLEHHNYRHSNFCLTDYS